MKEDLFEILSKNIKISPVNYLFLEESVMTRSKIVQKKVKMKFYNSNLKTVTRHHKPISKIFNPINE